jgi:hypothetical protein
MPLNFVAMSWGVSWLVFSQSVSFVPGGITGVDDEGVEGLLFDGELGVALGLDDGSGVLEGCDGPSEVAAVDGVRPVPAEATDVSELPGG